MLANPQLPSFRAPKNSKFVSLNCSLITQFGLEVNEKHTTVPKVLSHLLDKPETISDADFFKEDMYSSPKFMFDQSK